MKTLKGIIYGLSVIWLLALSIMYTLVIAYEGLEEINYCELDGGYYFVTIIAIWVVIVRYPIKQWLSKMTKEIKKEIKDRQKERQAKKQVKTA